MVRREGQSDFLDKLHIDDEGEIQIFEDNKSILTGNFTKEQACAVIRKIARHDIIAGDTLDAEIRRIQSGESHFHVFDGIATQFNNVKGATDKLPIKTAKLFRQLGIFKFAEKQVYQDLETGDFWKISEDGKTVLRMFNELEDGVADKVS